MSLSPCLIVLITVGLCVMSLGMGTSALIIFSNYNITFGIITPEQECVNKFISFLYPFGIIAVANTVILPLIILTFYLPKDKDSSLDMFCLMLSPFLEFAFLLSSVVVTGISLFPANQYTIAFACKDYIINSYYPLWAMTIAIFSVCLGMVSLTFFVFVQAMPV